MLALPDSALTIEQQTLFFQIFNEDRPLIDLRAPGEFAEGAFPRSCNLPLMSDQERAQVGTIYKREGKQAAIELGHELVSGSTRDNRMQGWQAFCEANPDGFLYCLRGGLRSQTVSQWLTEAGIEYPRIAGGYKALRRYLIEVTAKLVADSKLFIIGGKTGSAKTAFVNNWQESVDLEGLANHRGSSFGRRATPQPTVITFENRIAIDLLQCCASGKLLVEDEGVTIGSCSVPLVLREAMKAAPVIMLDIDFDERVATILNDYVIDLSEEFAIQDQIMGYENYKANMLSALSRIKKRLGGVMYETINQKLTKALETRRPEDHRDWIVLLLEKYYDPMYAYQLENKAHRITFQGNRQEVSEFVSKQGFSVIE